MMIDDLRADNQRLRAENAGFPNAARVAGYSYPKMATQIVEWAWGRRIGHA